MIRNRKSVKQKGLSEAVRGFYTPTGHHTEPVRHEPDRVTHYMQDHDHRRKGERKFPEPDGHFYDCLHETVHFRIFPQVDPPGFESHYPYQEWYETLGGSPGVNQFCVPTMYLFEEALKRYPRFADPVRPQYFNVKVGSLERIPLKSILYNQGLLTDFPDAYHGKFTAPKLSLAQDWSLVNFLLEWRDVLNSVKRWFSKGDLRERYEALLGRNASLRGRARALANERLAYSFGDKNLISDMRTFLTIIATWRERADRLFAKSQLLNRVHYKVIGPTGYGNRTSIGFPIFQAPESELIWDRDVTAEVHGTMSYRFLLPKQTTWLARLCQLMDSLGVRLDLGVAWDAIPFSFVIDWFVKIGEYVHKNASIDWQHADLLTIDFCESLKLTVTDTLKWERYCRDPLGPFVVKGSTDIATRVWTCYDRRVGEIPRVTPDHIETNKQPWRIGRILNAASLVTQFVVSPSRVKRKDADKARLLLNKELTAKLNQLLGFLKSAGFKTAAREKVLEKIGGDDQQTASEKTRKLKYLTQQVKRDAVKAARSEGAARRSFRFKKR